jgi:hypothetical protein
VGARTGNAQGEYNETKLDNYRTCLIQPEANTRQAFAAEIGPAEDQFATFLRVALDAQADVAGSPEYSMPRGDMS